METTEEQLVRTKKELEDLKNEYERFSYIISHDFRSPFRQIDGFARILASRYEDKLDDNGKKYFSLIISGVEQCNKNLEASLELSRINNQQVIFNPIDVNKIVGFAKEKLKSEIEEFKPKILYEKLPLINGDFNQLFELFYHVIKNAIIYNNANKSLEISLNCVKNENNWQFCIKDNGLGIKNEIINDVFIAMYKGIKLGKYQGQGMGLAIAKKVVNNHFGKIWIDSDVNLGTKLFVSLPINI